MNGYFYILIILVVLLLWPYGRIFVKRLSFYRRLIAVCRKRSFKLTGTHFGWLFSPWWYKRYDFLLEGDRVLYPVKLFACPRRLDKLVFSSEKTFFFSKRMVLIGRTMPTTAALEIPTRTRTLPDYDFSIERDIWDVAEVKPILLLHPVCMEVRRDSRSSLGTESLTMGSWDRLGQMYICTSSRLLDELATYDHTSFLYR